MDEFRLDSHKLMYHPCRICKWMAGSKIYPIYVEISLTSACNHRCIFCAPSFFQNYKSNYLDTKVLKKVISDMAVGGVKAIMFGGEGEPLLHPDIREIINYTKRLGIDVSLTTNGVLLSENMWRYIGNSLSWIKVSIDAGYPETYAKIHRTKKSDLITVFKNLRYMIKIKNTYDWECTIGTQSILLNENKDEIMDLADNLKTIGVNYLTIKPLSKHSLGECKNLEDVEETDDLEHKIGLFNINSNDFKIIFRANEFMNVNEDKPYDKCYGQDFMAYIDSLGGVHSCINFIDDNEYCYGNIYNKSFIDIWRHKRGINPDLSKCRTICRLDDINRYLWNLKNPSAHVNFI